MPALQILRSRSDGDSAPAGEAPASDQTRQGRTACPYYAGAPGGWDATCSRNENPEPIHTAFQRIHCTSQRHERCEVFLGQEASPLPPGSTERSRLRIPVRVALPGILGVALVVAASFVFGGLPGIGAGADDSSPAVASASIATSLSLDTTHSAVETGPSAGTEPSAEESTAAVTAIGTSSSGSSSSVARVPTPDRIIGGPPAFLPALIPFLIALQRIDLTSSLNTVIGLETPAESHNLPADLVPANGLFRVRTTSGNGIAHRSDCVSSARMSTGWVDTQLVELRGIGIGRCEGWSYAEWAGVSAWIQTRWLTPVA